MHRNLKGAVEEQKAKEQRAKAIKQEAYKGRILRLQTETLAFEDGTSCKRDIVRHPGAAAVLPIDREGNLLLIQQYRRPIDQITIEIPAGTLDAGEEPITCAARELREEAGFRAKEITPLGFIYTAPGFTDEKVFLFLARDLTLDPLPPDDHEVIELYPISLENALEAIKRGVIVDAKTIVSIYYYERELR